MTNATAAPLPLPLLRACPERSRRVSQPETGYTDSAPACRPTPTSVPNPETASWPLASVFTLSGAKGLFDSSTPRLSPLRLLPVSLRETKSSPCRYPFRRYSGDYIRTTRRASSPPRLSAGWPIISGLPSIFSRMSSVFWAR